MPNIKPISELRNYGELLREVTVGSPVVSYQKRTWPVCCYGHARL